MLFPEVCPFEISKACIFDPRCLQLLVNDHRLERHEVQLRALELVMVLFWAILAMFILEDEGQLLLIIDGEIVLLIKLTGPDDVQKIAEFYLHDQGVVQSYHVVVDILCATQEAIG